MSYIFSFTSIYGKKHDELFANKHAARNYRRILKKHRLIMPNTQTTIKSVSDNILSGIYWR